MTAADYQALAADTATETASVKAATARIPFDYNAPLPDLHIRHGRSWEARSETIPGHRTGRGGAGMSKLPHYVSVETFPYSGDFDFEPTTKFECPWLYGDCHFYPACDCESWDGHHLAENGPGHERVWHEECWMQGWFDSECGACYEGADADDMNDSGLPNGMNRSGEITTSWEYDYVGWEFKS